MIVVLIAGTLLGVFEFAIGVRRLRDRLRALEADEQDAAGESLAPSALMVLGGAAVSAVGLALLPFAAAGAMPTWVGAAAGGPQILMVAATAGGAWFLGRR